MRNGYAWTAVLLVSWLVNLHQTEEGTLRLGLGRDAHAWCIWGCKDRLHHCNDGCSLNTGAFRSCDDVVEAVEARVRHHIHHHCKGQTNAKQVIDCGWDHTRGDEYGRALEQGGLLRKYCRNDLGYFKNRIYHHPEVVKKIREHIGYWREGNFWAKLETAKDRIMEKIGEGLSSLGTFVFDTSCRAALDIGVQVSKILKPLCSRPGGRTVASRCSLERPREPCAPSRRREHFQPPRALQEGQNEGRLRDDLRAAARKADAMASLCKAAEYFAKGDVVNGSAFADLAVTGKRAFQSFLRQRPTDARLQRCRKGLPAAAVKQALDRAYKVVQILRTGNKAARHALRPEYIAVSGEDDQPHRPVNVPWSDFPQYDLEVSVPRRHSGGGAVKVHTRFTIGHRRAPASKMAIFGPRDIPPDAKPELARDAVVIVYVHGMDSRAEEADHVAHALHKVGTKNWTMISMDLPTSGYATKIDHLRLGSLDLLGQAADFPRVFINPDNPKFAVLDFIEDFIVNFIETLDRKIGGVKRKVQAVIGGSLGGNMTLRLGRRGVPWIRNVVSWSPGAIWNSYAKGADTIKDKVLKTAWHDSGGNRDNLTESFGNRKEFFSKAFGKPFPTMPAQPDMWWRAGWECKEAYKAGARVERQEIYNREFRLWHWRLGMEQLVYSHWGTKPRFRPFFLDNKTRMILACGTADEFCFTNICSATIQAGLQMTRTPGELVVLEGIGHSIHDEVPRFWARKIVDFIERR